MTSSIELAIRCLAAVVLVVCAFTSAYRLAWRVVDDDAFLLRWSATGVIGMWLATVGFHALFAGSVFALPAAVGAAVVVALVVRRRVLAERTSALLLRDLRLVKRAGTEAGAGRGLRVLFFFAPFAALLLARCLIQPPLAWDWTTYHGVRAALFVQGEGWTFLDAPGSWGLYRHFFAGSEVLSAWAMLPLHSDLLASLAEWVQWILLGIAVAALARLLGLGWEATAVAASAALFVPCVRLMVPSGYNELELNFALVACVALTVAFLQRAEAGHLLLALLAAGVAVGIKPTAALPCAAAIGCAAAAALLSRRHRGRRTLAALALGAVLALLAPLPWMVLALRDTGLPLSPLPVGVLGVDLGVANPEMQAFQQRDVSGAYTLQHELAALRMVFAPVDSRKEVLGLLTLVPLLVFPAGALAGSLGRPRAGVLVPVLAALAVAAFYFLPATAVVRLNLSTSSSRFLIGLAVLALPVSLLGFAGWPRLQHAYALLLFGIYAFYAIWYATFGIARSEVALLVQVAAVVGLAAVLAHVLGDRLQMGWGLAAVAAVVACVGMARLQALQDRTRAAFVRDSTQLHGQVRYWSEAASLLDDPSEPRVVAVTAGPDPSSDHWFTYFFLGRRLQNRLVYFPITADGRVFHPGPGVGRRAHGDRDAWLARVLASPVSDVMSFRPRSVEQGWMESDPRHFEKLAGGARWGLFRVIRDGPAGQRR